MKGWHGQSLRHSLAARGMITTKFDTINRYRKEPDGFMYIYDDDEPMGWTDIVMGEDRIRHIYGNGIPSRTAIIDGIRIYDQYQDKGYGRRLLKASENYAIDHGMKRMWIMGVVNRKFFELNGYREIESPIDCSKPTYEKVLR